MVKTLIRLPNWIGDAVMATPAVRLLAERCGEEGISIWGPPQTAGLFHHFPGVSRVFELDEKKEPARIEEIRSSGYDRVFLLTNSYSTAKAAKQAGIAERIGYRRQWRGPLLTRPVPCGPRTRALHMVDYYLHLLPKEWRRPPLDRQPSLYCSEEDLEACRKRIETQRKSVADKNVAFTPGAAFGTAKQWFPENYRALASALGKEGHFLVLFGSENDRELGDFILGDAPKDGRLNLAGKTNLRELMATISLCDCLVTNDSGPMHIADAVGTPAVAFFGSTDSNWTGPQATHHRVLQADVACNPCFLRECPLNRECMMSLGVPSALEAVRAILTDSAR